jgi:hypothetical protein
MPDGSQIQSKSGIKKAIAEKHGGLSAETTLSNSVDFASEIDPQTVVIRGKYQVNGIKILGLHKQATGTFVLRQA